MIPASKDPLKFIQFDKVPRLINKYKGLVTLPLDLPLITLDDQSKFWEIWDKEVEEVRRQNIDRGAEGINYPQMDVVQWQGLTVHENLFLLDKLAWNTKMSIDMAMTQKQYIKQLTSALSFLKIRSIRFWSATMPIPAHYDGNYPEELNGVFDFPTEIRLMLYDENPQQTFWLVKAGQHKPHTAIDNTAKHYIKLPNTTNTFIWNNESYLHGADYDSKYKKILVVIKGWITDMDALEQLIDRSIEKYPNYVVRDSE